MPTRRTILHALVQSHRAEVLLDLHKVRKEIQDFLVSEDVQCTTVLQFAVILSEEEGLVKDPLEEASMDMIKIGDQIAVRWGLACMQSRLEWQCREDGIEQCCSDQNARWCRVVPVRCLERFSSF